MPVLMFKTHDLANTQAIKRSSDALIFRSATKLSANPAPIDPKFIYIQTSRHPPGNPSRTNEIPTCTAWIAGRRPA
jgi:hypothetical protein